MAAVSAPTRHTRVPPYLGSFADTLTARKRTNEILRLTNNAFLLNIAFPPFPLFDQFVSVHPKIVDFGSGQGLAVFATDDATIPALAGISVDFKRAKTPSWGKRYYLVLPPYTRG
jgi:hypothetical protein